jgi:hypothetical protein
LINTIKFQFNKKSGAMSKKTGNDKTTNAKRDSIRKILVGGGVVTAGHMVPAKWTKAVVNSVVLPAHAQMSPGTGTDDGGGSGGSGSTTTPAPTQVITAAAPMAFAPTRITTPTVGPD